MAFIKKEVLDKIEVVGLESFPMIQCRYSIWVEDDETGEIFGSKQFHRHVVTPVSDLSQEDITVQNIAGSLFTEQVKAAYTEQTEVAES